MRDNGSGIFMCDVHRQHTRLFQANWTELSKEESAMTLVQASIISCVQNMQKQDVSKDKESKTVSGRNTRTEVRAYALTESDLLLPRFYGLSHFGKANVDEMTDGEMMSDT
eukprot:6188232-Pleurochrysis_carterae.AAC.1